MDMARRILEGIHEVELDITPEFRKPSGAEVAKGGAAPVWAEPETQTWGISPRIDYYWPDKEIVRGVEAKAHGNAYAISWLASSFGIEGHWVGAIRAILKKDPWNRIYVYGVPEGPMDEFKDLVSQGVVRAAFLPGGGGDPEYDANIVDMLKQYVGSHQEPGLEPEPKPKGETFAGYPVLYKTLAIEGLIGNRPWVDHTGKVISKDHPVVVKAPPGDLEAMASVESVLDATGLTYEPALGPWFHIYGSPGMTKAQIHKAFTKLLPDLDTVLGGPKP